LPYESLIATRRRTELFSLNILFLNIFLAKIISILWEAVSLFSRQGMCKKSPLGPFEYPKDNIVTTTNHARKIFGPGHGCIFNVPGTDNYYFAYLEYGRGITNRMTYVNKLEFNEDGTLRPVDLTMDGIGTLHAIAHDKKLKVVNAEVSSKAPDLVIRPSKDTALHRTESFATEYAFDGLNGSRWMADKADTACWIIADLGKTQKIKRSELREYSHLLRRLSLASPWVLRSTFALWDEVCTKYQRTFTREKTKIMGVIPEYSLNIPLIIY